MEDSCEPENRLALLSQMRRQNKDADPAAYSSGGFSAVLPKVQIQLCDSIPERKNRRVETAMKKHPALADACDAVLSLLSGSFALLAIGLVWLKERIGGTDQDK